MLTAFADVVRGGKDVGLLLVGAPDDILARVAALPAAARGRVVTLPPTSSDGQLAGYFSAMDGFLHVSRIGESFGMVLCEAMLCGVPVVTLSTPLKDNGQLETVGHRRGGLVALEAGALPRAMTGLMADDTLRAEVRSNGADWVMQRFGIDRVAGQLVEIYEAVLRDGPLPDLPVTDGKWIDEIAALGIGEKPGPAARLAFRLLHQPQVYRGYLGLRRVTARLS
jgi:glycosyltransferase involved in cell wall biosynthesis